RGTAASWATPDRRWSPRLPVLLLLSLASACKDETPAPSNAAPVKSAAPGKSAATPVRVMKDLNVQRLEPGVTFTIDGKLDEPAWGKAPSTGPLVDVGNGRENPALPTQGNVRVCWDDEAMYVGFEARDAKVRGGWPADAKDPHLWEKDTVEIMIDP